MPPNKNTARSYIIACVNACKERKGFKKALDFYTKKMDMINAELKDSTAKTDRYKDNEVSWDHVLEARDRLPKGSVEYVLMSLYTMMPPRRNQDYIMQVGRPQENSNWYDGKDFYFGQYKTKGSYQTQIVHVPPELKNVIDHYLETRPFRTALGRKTFYLGHQRSVFSRTRPRFSNPDRNRFVADCQYISIEIE